MFFNVLINLSAKTDFVSLSVECFLYHYLATMISLIYCETHSFYLPIFCLVCKRTHLKNFKNH